MTARLLGACGKSPLPMARGDRNTFWKGETLPNAGSRRKGKLSHGLGGIAVGLTADATDQ